MYLQEICNNIHVQNQTKYLHSPLTLLDPQVDKEIGVEKGIGIRIERVVGMEVEIGTGVEIGMKG